MARRLNTRFLTILMLVVAGIIVAVVLAHHFLIRDRPARYVAAGQEAMKDHKWDDAVANFLHASRLAPQDPNIDMLLGQALSHVVETDPAATKLEISAYQQALVADPKYLPALKALSDFFRKAASESPRADFYRNAIDYSRRVHDVDPTDESYQSLADRLVIEEWTSGLEADQKEVDAAIKRLQDLHKQHPEDPDPPFSLANAQIQQGMMLAAQYPGRTQPDEVTQAYKKAAGIFESIFAGPSGASSAQSPSAESPSTQPSPAANSAAQNATMHYYFARILVRLAAVDQSSPEALTKYQDRAQAEMDKARELVKPADPNYLEINEFAADVAMRRGDRAGAIAIYKKMPDSPLTHLALADVLSRSMDTQQEAADLLRSSLASLHDDQNHIAVYGMRFSLMLELAKVQVFQYAQMPAGPDKQKLHDQLRATIDKLNQVAGVRIIYPLKEAEARLQIYSGTEEEMQAVQSLAKLLADNPPPAKDYYSYVLNSLLAQAYEDTNQISNALSIMRNVVTQFPKDANARKHLVALLLMEQPDQAPEQIAELEQLAPNDPALAAFKVQLLLNDPQKNKDKIEAFYRGLKEDNIQEISAKARVALRIQNYDDASRLLKLIVAKDPSQTAYWVMLARLQYMEDKKDEALDTANRGLAANPKDPELRLLIPRIKGESPEVIQDLQIELAKENPDKSQGELILAEMAQRRGDVEGQGQHLEAALKAAPNNSRIEDLLFNYYVQQGKFDKAAGCIPPLAAADADRAGGQLYRLALAEAQKDIPTADAIAQKLTQDKPEFARSWLAMGDVMQNEGRYEEAIRAYNTCLQKEADLLPAYIGLAHCFYARQQPDNALHTIEEGLKHHPDDQELTNMRLQHDLSYGDPAQAIHDIQAQLDNHKDQPMLYAALADAILRYCDVLRKAGQTDDSVKQAQQGIAVLQDPLKKWPDEPKLYMALSECQLAANKPQDAIDTMQKWAARPVWTKQAEPYLAMSELYERFGDPANAEDQMHTAMARSGYRTDLQIRMASLLTIHKKYDEALTLLRSVNADKPEIREKVIQILLVEGKYDDAHKELQNDLATNPPDAESLLSTWALACYERQQYQDSIDSATQALALDPQDATALFCRARAKLHLQPPDAHGALADLEVVRQKAPTNIEIRLTMADAYLVLNQSNEAINELQAGLRVMPNNKPLRMKLVNLLANGPHPRLPEALKLLQDVDSIDPFDKDAEVFQNESVILAKLGSVDDAIAKVETARHLAPADENVARTELQLILSTQNFQSVVDRYNALNDKMKAASWALWDLGQAERGLSSPNALADYGRALVAAEKEDQPVELDTIARSIAQNFSFDDAVNAVQPIAGEYVSARITLARLYQIHGDDDAALSAVDAVLRNIDKISRRDQINALSNAALMYQIAKPPQADKAYDAYQRWIKLDPENLEALNNMACLLADDYNPPRAQEGLEFANRAVAEMARLGRTEPRMLDTQAWLKILTGSPEEGIDILNKAMDAFEPFPDEYLHLGEGYLRKQLPDPQQAEIQAKMGMQLISRRKAGQADAPMAAKLQDLINRSEELKHTRAQARVP